MKIERHTILSNQGDKKQSGEIHRKLKLRRQLLRLANPDGAVYLPFCGSGDIATVLFQGRNLYAADKEKTRAEQFRKRLPGSTAIAFDCDLWPFRNLKARFSVADFDSWAYPYYSFHSFWKYARKKFPLAVYFTDGQLQPLTRFGNYRTPDGEKVENLSLVERRKLRNFYWRRVALKWIREFAAKEGLKVVTARYYISIGGRMINWGAVLDE